MLAASFRTVQHGKLYIHVLAVSCHNSTVLEDVDVQLEACYIRSANLTSNFRGHSVQEVRVLNPAISVKQRFPSSSLSLFLLL